MFDRLLKKIITSLAVTILMVLAIHVAPINAAALGPAPASSFSTTTFDDGSAAADSGTITQITVYHGDVIDSLEFTYSNKDTFGPYGGFGGSESTVTFTEDDPLIAVSGYVGGYFGGQHVLQLYFRSLSQTGDEVSGPYGTLNFSSSVEPFCLGTSYGGTEMLQAFFGGSFRHSDGGDFISALGAYTSDIPVTSSTAASNDSPCYFPPYEPVCTSDCPTS